jgi:Tfp pilus assembly protein PilF
LFKENKLKEAQELCKKALEIDPNQINCWNLSGIFDFNNYGIFKRNIKA